MRFIALLAASTALASCATTSSTAGPSTAEVAEQTATVSDAAVGPVAPATSNKPQLGTFGFDTAGMDSSVQAGQNFYNYANGTWAKNTPIPADKSNYGMFTMLDDLSRQRTREILDEARANENSKIGSAYAAFLDEPAIEAKGLAPIQPWLAKIRGLSNKAGYAALMAEANRNGVPGLFSGYVGQDDKNPEVYAFIMGQSGLGMPDRDYYLSNDPKLADTRAKYLAHLTNMLTLAGEADAPARAKALLDFETGIARAHWTQVESRDAVKTYNKMTVAQLAGRAPGIDYAAYLLRVGANVSDVIVQQPTAFTGIAAAVTRAPLSVLKDQLLIRTLTAYAPVLPNKFDREQFAFHGTVIGGTPEQEARWKRGVDLTVGTLTDEVSKVYVERYFPPETKAAADELVKNVVAAMERRIDGLDWMTPATKAQARAKLAAFTPKIGYPDRWRDFSGLEIRRDDAAGNLMRSAQFAHAYNLGKLGQPIYRWEWGMTPMTVNAYANFGMTEIVFPAAILQPPFFDPNADPAVNYGGIGAVIGHEISHHFDDQGAKYDLKGRLSDWWTAADTQAFNARLGKLGTQYDAYEPLPGLHVNGKLTMGENVADLAGLTVAYDAWKHSLDGREPETVDGVSGDQRFYLGWAQVWRRNYREENLRQRLLTDTHSPSEQRVSVVRNLDPWYGAFDVQPGQALYLDPANRVRIW